jgi:saccharopine dehydrogenase-like NADP-dependent oxidoreductase
VAQLIATGAITGRGVLPPEVAVPVAPFFAELCKRGMRIEMKESKP